MGLRDTDIAFEQFKQNHNTVEDLLTTEELSQYNFQGYPNNVEILYTALKRKVETDPDYEVWVPLKYYRYAITLKQTENLFRETNNVYISNRGNLFHLRRQTVASQGNVDGNGYYNSRYRLDDDKIQFRTHRAVGCCFIPLPQELKHYGHNNLQINHKDVDKSNNDFLNLEWCTGSQNVQHAVDNKLRIYLKGSEHYSVKPVLGEVHLEGPYQGFKFILAGKEHIDSVLGGAGSSSVMSAASGKLKQAKGCYWSYATEEDISNYDNNIISEELKNLLRNTNANWKEPIIATRISDGHLILIEGGPKQMAELGFTSASIYVCCTGNLSEHKGYTFRRAKDQIEVEEVKQLITKQTTIHIPPPKQTIKIIIATRLTDGHVIILKGAKDILALGWDKSGIYGRLKKKSSNPYRGYIIKEISEGELPKFEGIVSVQYTKHETE